jgi:hypothetical protein
VKIKSLLAGVLLFAAGVQATTVQRLALEDLVKKAHRIVAAANTLVVNADGTWGVGEQIFTYVGQPLSSADSPTPSL